MIIQTFAAFQPLCKLSLHGFSLPMDSLIIVWYHSQLEINLECAKQRFRVAWHKTFLS